MGFVRFNNLSRPPERLKKDFFKMNSEDS